MQLEDHSLKDCSQPSAPGDESLTAAAWFGPYRHTFRQLGRLAPTIAVVMLTVLTTGCGVVVNATAQSARLAYSRAAAVPVPAGGDDTAAPPAISADAVDADTLLALLRFVPNQTDYRPMLTYGNALAWYHSWDVPRLSTIQELETLAAPARRQWLTLMGLQTTPPKALGVEYLLAEDQRASYGFSFFDAQQFLEAGDPPGTITVVAVDADPDLINEHLLTFGYIASPYTVGDATVTLYRLGNDYELHLASPTMVGRLGELNRIALIRQAQQQRTLLVIGRADGPIEETFAAYRGATATLADDPSYQAAITALFAPTLADTGALVGLILMGEPNFDDPLRQVTQEPPVTLSAMSPLPPIRVAAFATRHTAGASYLIMALVFPLAAKTQVGGMAAIAETLATRLTTYKSVVTQRGFEDKWRFVRTITVENAGPPVVLAVMEVADPPPDTPTTSGRILSWLELIVQRDLLFLANGID